MNVLRCIKLCVKHYVVAVIEVASHRIEEHVLLLIVHLIDIVMHYDAQTVDLGDSAYLVQLNFLARLAVVERHIEEYIVLE